MSESKPLQTKPRDNPPRMIEVFDDGDGGYRFRWIGQNGATTYISPTRYPTRGSAHAVAEVQAIRYRCDVVDDR